MPVIRHQRIDATGEFPVRKPARLNLQREQAPHVARVPAVSERLEPEEAADPVRAHLVDAGNAEVDWSLLAGAGGGSQVEGIDRRRSSARRPDQGGGLGPSPEEQADIGAVEAR